jgi:hypothetical protein
MYANSSNIPFDTSGPPVETFGPFGGGNNNINSDITLPPMTSPYSITLKAILNHPPSPYGISSSYGLEIKANNDFCGQGNYQTVADISRSPAAVDLTAPNWSYADARANGALKAKLGWTFDSGACGGGGTTQSAYQIIINTANSRLNPAPVFDSGKCYGMYICGSPPVSDPVNCAKCKATNGATGTTFFPLAASDGAWFWYNTPYYWWVKVWDSNDLPSANWAQYDTVQDTPYPEADDGAPLTFTTYKHEFPKALFSYFVADPSKKEKVQFIDKSKIYKTANPETAVDCATAEIGDCRWEWTATGATFDDEENGPTSRDPIIIFNSVGDNTVKLKVIDADEYWTEYSETINVNVKLPNWREVKP